MVEVIPLVWSQSTPPDKSCPYDHVTALCPLGTYSIEWKGWKEFDSKSIMLEQEWVGCEDTLDEAKGKAALHFQEKVMSCLVPKLT